MSRVNVCPTCEGEGSYADGVDEGACSEQCLKCEGEGWVVDPVYDAGIEMLREANASFGNYTAPEPGVPDMSDRAKGWLTRWAGRLAEMAQEAKEVATQLRIQGDDAGALLVIRCQLSMEETGEWTEALVEGDLAHIAKELSDMSYVTDGHYLTLGLGDLKLPIYRANHEANMSKLGEDGKPIISDAGRWVKGPNYRPADIGAILNAK